MSDHMDWDWMLEEERAAAEEAKAAAGPEPKNNDGWDEEAVWNFEERWNSEQEASGEAMTSKKAEEEFHQPESADRENREQKPDGQKDAEQKAEARKPENQKAEARKPENRKPEDQRSEPQNPDGQKMEGQKNGKTDREKKRAENRYGHQELSAFCLQISLLLEAAVPLDEGLSIMAEDAGDHWEKEMLLSMSEHVEQGQPFYQVLDETKAFPPYVIRMAKLGQSTGTLDQMMQSLSEYYEKEYFLMRNIKNALTYPIIMIFMLLAVLFVLFVKVMPIFEDVYSQLGAEISGVARSAIRFGGVFSGVALAVGAVLLVTCSGLWMATKLGGRISLVEKLVAWTKRRSKIALAVSNRRFTSVLALTLHSGLELEKGLELAAELAENQAVEEKIGMCRRMLMEGQSYYEAMKATGLFSGFHIQMIKTGARSGHLDHVMEDISQDYEQQADTAIDNVISRFEPTMVAVLAVAVGLVLLSVMLPLVGVLSTIG